jgi:uncharacterized protein (DUF1786 family)
MNEDFLILDVGSGTQDILVFQSGKNIENCPKLVVPSRTQIVASEIREATRLGKDIFFYGHLMGGGACGFALQQHIKAGFKAYATSKAALTFHDNLDKVKQMGVEIIEKAPSGAVEIWMGDIDLESFAKALSAFGITPPKKYAVAVQDHGYSVHESNRTLRFRLWAEFVAQGGNLAELIFVQDIPSVYTRMQAIREIIPDSIVTDTGTAAVLGIMTDPQVQRHLQDGVIALNIGNSHTLGAAVRGNRVYGIFEQHTSALDQNSLKDLVRRFQEAVLTHEEVFETGGHGVALHLDMKPGWDFVAVAGPRREMADTMGWYKVAPYGDMMLTGCFGILKGLNLV